MIWYFLLSLHFIVEILGVISHFAFLKLVVFQGSMDVYCRISLGIISISMLTMIISFVAETMVCLSIGTVFEDVECARLEWKFYLLLVHRYAEMLSLVSLLFFTIERFLSILFSKIHRTFCFKTFFTVAIFMEHVISAVYMYTVVFFELECGLMWLLVLQFIILANFPFVYYAKKVSKSKYGAQVTTYSLKRKHNLYNYYEIARSFVYASAIYLGAQLTVFVMLWFYVAELLFPEEFHKLVFINGLIWNSNLSLFPWIVMLIHRSQRDKIYKVWSNMFPDKSDSPKILGMNGKQLVTLPTQSDHFNQLQKAWE